MAISVIIRIAAYNNPPLAENDNLQRNLTGQTCEIIPTGAVELWVTPSKGSQIKSNLLNHELTVRMARKCGMLVAQERLKNSREYKCDPEI